MKVKQFEVRQAERNENDRRTWIRRISLYCQLFVVKDKGFRGLLG